MKVRAQPRPQTIEQARAELSRRLQARREEIEAAVMTRVYSVSDTSDLDPTYAEGLRTAISAAVDYGLAAVELGEERSEPPPPILLAQARIAARNGIGLDTVLRRYFAGQALLGDFLIEEAEGGRLLRGAALQSLLRTQAALFDRLVAAVAEEHGREAQNRAGTSEERRAERIERLLAGELVDASDLGYDFEGHHVALMAKGERVDKLIRDLARKLDRRLLAVRLEEEPVLACWLGGRQPLAADQALRALDDISGGRVVVAVGESGEGLQGWRLSHRQARAAFSLAKLSPASRVRYMDVAMLASIAQDELLLASLREVYLAPLSHRRDGGEVLRQTLRAYFAAERNIASAASQLGISPQAAGKRLRVIEAVLDCPIGRCAFELEAALRLEELGALRVAVAIGQRLSAS